MKLFSVLLSTLSIVHITAMETAVSTTKAIKVARGTVSALLERQSERDLKSYYALQNILPIDEGRMCVTHDTSFLHLIDLQAGRVVYAYEAQEMGSDLVITAHPTEPRLAYTTTQSNQVTVVNCEQQRILTETFAIPFNGFKLFSSKQNPEIIAQGTELVHFNYDTKKIHSEDVRTLYSDEIFIGNCYTKEQESVRSVVNKLTGLSAKNIIPRKDKPGYFVLLFSQERKEYLQHGRLNYQIDPRTTLRALALTKVAKEEMDTSGFIAPLPIELKEAVQNRIQELAEYDSEEEII